MDLQTFLVNAEKYDCENTTAVWLNTLRGQTSAALCHMIREVIKNLPYDGLHCLNIEVKIRKEPYIFCLKLVHLHCSFSQCAEDIYWHYICYMIAFLTLGSSSSKLSQPP